MEIDVEEFIGVKGFKAKGKRISTWVTDTIEELEPTRFPEPEPEPETPDVPDTPESPDEEEIPEKSEQQVIDEMTGQLSLFPDE
jgi:topoisomerase-4 subunit A